MKNIFPKEFINISLEHYTFRISKTSHAIYLIIIISVCTLIAMLPIIYVPVSVQATGLITTQSQRFQLIAPASGTVYSHKLTENSHTYKGDTLLHMDQSIIKAELHQVKNRLQLLGVFVADLDHLSTGAFDKINSDRYQIEYLQYKTNLDQFYLRKKALKKIFERQQTLFDQQVISAADYEKAKADYEQLQAETDYFKKQTMNDWKQAVTGFDEEMYQLQLKEKQLQNELPKYILIAPAKGEIQNVVPTSIGQFISSGTKLGEITPDTTLLAVCYVSPESIGLLLSRMQGSFRVDAFNSNDWGMATGKISNISSDAYIQENQSFFKVTCLLDTDHLTLKNGYKGEFKKGMTFQANFEVSNRSLYQLLYDKVDNWLNPLAKTNR